MTTIDPRYPIGKFEPQDSYTSEDVKININRIAALPEKMKKALHGLSDAQLDTPYRDDGWTVRQVVHHVPDSHMNAYIRFKWSLTEDSPLIKAYDEKGWAVTPETSGPPSISTDLLTALHAKWTVLLKGLSTEDLRRDFTHPDTKKLVPLDRLIATYAWHGEHHLAHITSLKERMKW
ncbi:MAG: putative metal-dependent hydrolase [Bacteroidota bacterium]